MPELFRPVTLGRLTLRNRFMRSATAERRADADGTPTPGLAEATAALAEGGVGLIVLGHTFVRPDGKASAGMSGLWRDDQVPAFAAIAAAVHAAGGVAAVQINHGGRQSNPVAVGGMTLAPSLSEWPTPHRALLGAEVWDLVEAYGQAARRVKEAGFDAVQLHGAHGYLVGQFLSPQANRREDEWGGDAERRARFLREVAARVRSYVGPDYPVLIKLGLADFIPNGLSLEEGLSVLERLEGWGIDLVEISGAAGAGNSPSGINSEAKEAYFLPWARQARQRTALPIALVGGFRTLAIMQAAVDEGAADLISLSRPLIREPDLPLRLAGRQLKARCVSCGMCSKRSDQPTRCWLD
jgi:2,4-dienoyl-CoA reductase-like NADH-dependent reductase (Old Yellow Enzyme family)